MPHSPKAGIAREATRVRAELRRLSRPVGEFDARRYFRGPVDLAFHNVGTPTMRALARSIHAAHRGEWTIDDAMAFAERLMPDRFLETKSVGIEVVARYRRDFVPRLLPAWERWLAKDYSANWATTDAICGALIGQLLVMHPALAPQMRSWSLDKNMWVRRASSVALIPLARRNAQMDVVYDVARRLHGDRKDLIQKAVGWLLREAGKSDERRLEKYLRANGPSMPRTTVRYAIERFPAAKRRTLLTATLRQAQGRPELRRKSTRGN